MKRYMAFYGHNYEPFGGINDFVGDHDTIHECMNSIFKEYSLWHSTHGYRSLKADKGIFYHIYDTHTRTKVVDCINSKCFFRDENGNECEELEEHRCWPVIYSQND